MEPAPRRRRLWPYAVTIVVLGAVVASLVVALVVVQRTEDPRPHATAGDVFDYPYQEDPLPHRGEVLLPWARLQVAAGGVSAELPEIAQGRANVRAPEGGSFVRVELVLDEDDPLIPLAAIAVPFAQETEVVLRSDGRDYSLSGPDGPLLDPNGPPGQGGSRWVAVDGAGSDLEVRITVDGVTQVLDASDGSVDAGPAAALAELPSADELGEATDRSCGDPERLDSTELRVAYRLDLDCRVTLTLRTPYVDGVGWAGEGRDFLVVHLARYLDTDLVSGRGRDKEYWDARSRLEVRYDGADALAPLVHVNELSRGALAIQDVDDPVQAVFEVPAGALTGDLTIDQVLDARLGDPFPTERRRVVLRWTVQAGGLT